MGYESYVTNTKKCGPGDLKVTRKGYSRAGKRVRGTTYCATDRGKPGRGPKTIPTPRKGALGGPGYTGKSAEARHRLLRKHVKDHGYASTISALQSRINLGHRTMSKAALRVFEVDKRWVQKTYRPGRNQQRTTPKQAAAAGRGAFMRPLQDAWSAFLYNHGMNRIPISRSFPGIKTRVARMIKDTAHQDELESSKAELSKLAALARKLSADPRATPAQAKQAARYASELADIRSQVETVTINPSKKEKDMDRNGPRTKRRRAARAAAAKKTTKKKGGSSAGLKKARAVQGAMRLGVSKTTANRLYDAGKLTPTGKPKKGARDIPEGMKEALNEALGPKKKKKKKATKKKAKKKATKKVAKRRTKKVAKKKRVKRAPPTPRKRGSARPIKVKKRGSAPTRGCKRAKPGAQSVASAARRVQAGEAGRSGKPLAYERWCRNFNNLNVPESQLDTY